MTSLRFLQIGLGSMGKRRIRNLLALGVKKESIAGFDVSADRRRETADQYGVKTFGEFKAAVKAIKPNVIIISTPPDKHAPYFLYAARNRISFFCEISTVNTGYSRLFSMLDGRSFVAAPSATFRFFEPIIKIKELIEKGSIGRPLLFDLYLGQYLPNWHPYEDYRKVYYAKRATGGAKEMALYDLCWVLFVMGGNLKRISGFGKKISSLSISANDVYSLSVETEDGRLGSMLIDTINRKAGRNLRVVGSQGTLEWDWLKYEIRLYDDKGKSRLIKIKKEKKFSHYNTRESAYVAEMKAFLDAVNGKKQFPYTFKEDDKIIKLVEAIK